MTSDRTCPTAPKSRVRTAKPQKSRFMIEVLQKDAEKGFGYLAKGYLRFRLSRSRLARRLESSLRITRYFDTSTCKSPFRSAIFACHGLLTTRTPPSFRKQPR